MEVSLIFFDLALSSQHLLKIPRREAKHVSSMFLVVIVSIVTFVIFILGEGRAESA